MTSGTVLIVDDDASARDALVVVLSEAGFKAHGASSGAQALEVIGELKPDVVLVDLKQSEMDSIEMVERGKQRLPDAQFIVATANARLDKAVEAMRKGAEQYITKPLEPKAAVVLVSRAVDRAVAARDAAGVKRPPRTRADRILGGHPAMQGVLELVEQVAPSRATVLIHGESGTGKELIASAIHARSNRRDSPFVKLNCAALAETLLESELFGHEKGAFTGAMARREGRFSQADGGTLFLDEVSEIPMPIQVKLLRFLQEREFERVGGNETMRVDVRVVAATNKDLRARVDDGLFREDLYFRLNVVEIDVPPLRARPSDIPILALHFMRRFASENDKNLTRIDDSAMEVLLSYSWPGNVRELENAIERAVVLYAGDAIQAAHLPPITKQKSNDSQGLIVPGMTMDEIERWAILRTLDAVGGSPTKAAEALGISRRTMQYRLKEWGMIKERKKLG